MKTEITIKQNLETLRREYREFEKFMFTVEYTYEMIRSRNYKEVYSIDERVVEVEYKNNVYKFCLVIEEKGLRNSKKLELYKNGEKNKSIKTTLKMLKKQFIKTIQKREALEIKENSFKHLYFPSRVEVKKEA